MNSGRIVFLDVDGVMSPVESLLMHGKSTYPPSAVQALNALCEVAEARIVLTSARLRMVDGHSFHEDLIKAGVKERHFHPDIALERSLAPFSRNENIKAFMQTHNIMPEHMVVIDDSNHNYGWMLGTRLVQPDSSKGLRMHDCNKALELLKLTPSLAEMPQEAPPAQENWLGRLIQIARGPRQI